MSTDTQSMRNNLLVTSVSGKDEIQLCLAGTVVSYESDFLVPNNVYEHKKEQQKDDTRTEIKIGGNKWNNPRKNTEK